MANKQGAVGRRIRQDRAGAMFWAFVAALPLWAFAALVVGAGVYVIVSEDRNEDVASALIVGAIAIAFAYFITIIARWTFSGVRAALTPQRIQVMWLRRFQTERDGGFRPSRVIDRLARYGISALTLQDRDVQLSYEQRRNRLAPVFWIFFLPIAAALGFVSVSSWRQTQEAAENFHPTADTFAGAIGEAIGHALATGLVLVLIIVIGMIAFIAATLVIMALAALAGPIGAMFSRNRDDFRSLPRLLRKVQAGRRKGASVLRISDPHWQDAVRQSLAAADCSIIDLSRVTENIAWEIGEANRAHGPGGLVFICEEGVSPKSQIVRSALGRDPAPVVFYPARAKNGERFARQLREAIYATADRG